MFEDISRYDKHQGMDESLPLAIMAVIRAKYVLPVGGGMGCLLEGAWAVCWRGCELSAGGGVGCLLEGAWAVCWRGCELSAGGGVGCLLEGV